MKSSALIIAITALLSLLTVNAQVFQWPEDYAATLKQGGTIQAMLFEEPLTLNPYIDYKGVLTNALSGPELIYRDWLGNRRYRRDDGGFNMFWAKEIVEEVPEQRYLITVREGWTWSDGVEMTTDDVMVARRILADPDVESSSFPCSEVEGEAVIYEQLSRYQFSITLPQAQINALANHYCGAMPAHIFLPVYELEGARGVKSMWSLDADPSSIVSGGPYLIESYRPGERVVFAKNPAYGSFVQAADGSPVPGPDSVLSVLTADANQTLSLAITGQIDFFAPRTPDDLSALSVALNSGTISGELHVNLGVSKSLNFITYNFNHSDPCKRALFTNPTFRQAMAILIDREAIVEANYGGFGFAAKDWVNEAARPFVAELEPFVFDPQRALQLLASIGYTSENAAGVLVHEETGCPVSFDLQTNARNELRSEEASIIAQLAAPYGVEITPLKVSADIWRDAILGGLDADGKREVDYDAQIWGLAGGDVDNPSFGNGLVIGGRLNSWNKSTTELEAWEILMDRLTRAMDAELDTDRRISIFQERAELMREYLPLTPLTGPTLHLYTNLSNVWPAEALDGNSMEAMFDEFFGLLATP